MLARRCWIPVALLAQLLLPSCFTILAVAGTLTYRDEILEVRATDEGDLLFTIGPRRSHLDGLGRLHLEGPELERLLGPDAPWPRASVPVERGQSDVAPPDASATRVVPLRRGPPGTWEQPAPIGWSVVYSPANPDEARPERARFQLLVRWTESGSPDRGVVLVLTDEPATAWDTLRGILAFSAVDVVILLIASL